MLSVETVLSGRSRAKREGTEQRESSCNKRWAHGEMLEDVAPPCRPVVAVHVWFCVDRVGGQAPEDRSSGSMDANRRRVAVRFIRSRAYWLYAKLRSDIRPRAETRKRIMGNNLESKDEGAVASPQDAATATPVPVPITPDEMTAQLRVMGNGFPVTSSWAYWMQRRYGA